MHFFKSVSTLLIISVVGSGNVSVAANVAANGDAQGLELVVQRETQSETQSETQRENSTDRRQEKLREEMTVTVPVVEKQNQNVPLVESYLVQGKLQDGEAALLAQLKTNAKDDQARFGLGVLQFLRAFEHLSQDLHRYGMRDLSTRGMGVRFVRVPIPSNRQPEVLSYQQLRKIAETFLKNLAQAEATLALISDPNVKLPLHFGMIRMDLNGDGVVEDSDTLSRVYAGLNGNNGIPEGKAKDFLICFDRGDVHWLRGYCHVLMTMCEVYLAHDSKEAFECTAHLLFTRVQSPYGFLSHGKGVHRIGGDAIDVVDLIALFHLIRCPVVEPGRMASALHHMEAVVAQSKESWKFIMAETDDDHEWLPNPNQTGVIPNVHVTNEMVTAWLEMMDQAQQVLSGDRLIPFWRGDESRGVNFRRVFLEPRTFDLILWVQGTAAAPYLQNGELTNFDKWRRIPQVFGRQFPGFALWFN